MGFDYYLWKYKRSKPHPKVLPVFFSLPRNSLVVSSWEPKPESASPSHSSKVLQENAVEKGSKMKPFKQNQKSDKFKKLTFSTWHPSTLEETDLLKNFVGKLHPCPPVHRFGRSWPANFEVAFHTFFQLKTNISPAFDAPGSNKLGCNGSFNSLLPHMLSQRLNLGIIGSIFGCLRKLKITSCHCNYHWSYLHQLSTIQNHQLSKSPSIFQNHQSIFAVSKKTSPPTSFPVQTQTPTKKDGSVFYSPKQFFHFKQLSDGKETPLVVIPVTHLIWTFLEQDDLRCQWRRSWEAIWKVIHIFNASLCSSYQVLYGKTTRIWPSNWFNVWQNSFTTCSILVLPLKINSGMLPASVPKEI